MSQKRPAEETVVDMRYTRIKLASPSPERSSESDTESIHSCQGYKTELVKDTSDTSSPPSSPPSHLYNIEYEVTDFKENKFKYYFSEDSEDKDFETLGSLVYNNSYGDSFDDALLGDTSEENSTSPTSNSDVDPGLPRNDFVDFEKCLLCKTDKKDISYPYCSTCFSQKKRFFPNRPKRRKNSFRKRESSLMVPKENENSDRREVDKKESLSDGLCEDSGVGSSEAQQSEDTVDGPSTSSCASNSSNSQGLSPDKICKVCFAERECGLFVHLNIAHLYGCYSCANKIWHHNGGCPLCRRKVFKIIKLL